MGNGNTDPGSKSLTHKSGQPLITGAISAGSAGAKVSGAKVSGAKVSGAMSQQRGDSGNESAPQKFVQLVGCRDPKVRSEPWVRPRAPQG